MKKKRSQPSPRKTQEDDYNIQPYIPLNITVHLGAPDQSAQNVVVSFPDYIKNVASSEIYPTWNESAIVANIYAQISFALNRVYTEFYISKGYNFNITNNTAIDQKFINGRNIFDNIDRIVDEIFNSYIRRIGFVEPLAAKYCNGTTVTCDGLSQWGSEDLAKQGSNSVEILKYYYGDDIELVKNAPVRTITKSYPGSPIRRGDTGPDVFIIQRELTSISQNYPAIPKLYPADGEFGESTEASVKKFQSIFNLTVDGIVGEATWYKLVFLYVGINQLTELQSLGIQFFGVSFAYPDAISEGNQGEKVKTLQYLLSVLAQFYSFLPSLLVTGTFGPETEESVTAFQSANNLPVTGVVNAATWDLIYRQFKGIYDTVLERNELFPVSVAPYPGTPLTIGSTGDNVRTLQQYLNVISLSYLNITPVTVTGVYGKTTVNTVREFQSQLNLPVTGITDELTWDTIARSYRELSLTTTTRPSQYPGNSLTLGSTDYEA